MRRFDNDLVWALAFILVCITIGAYYETLSVRDQAAHRACMSINDGRENLNRRSDSLAHYITTVLMLNAAARKLQPTPHVLVKLEGEEVAALKHLRAEQKPLPLVSCP